MDNRTHVNFGAGVRRGDRASRVAGPDSRRHARCRITRWSVSPRASGRDLINRPCVRRPVQNVIVFGDVAARRPGRVGRQAPDPLAVSAEAGVPGANIRRRAVPKVPQRPLLVRLAGAPDPGRPDRRSGATATADLVGLVQSHAAATATLVSTPQPHREHTGALTWGSRTVVRLRFTYWPACG